MTLAEGDVRVLYTEGPARPPSPSDVQVTGPDGATVTLRPYDGELRYDVPGPDAEVGVAVGRFTAPQAGPYEVGSTAFTGTLAVGTDLAPGTLRAIVLPALLGLTSFVAGLVLAVRTAIRQSQGA